MKRSFALLAAMLCLTVPAVGVTEADDLKAGDTAPGFSLPGTDGKTHALKDFQGKQVVVLAWFPKAVAPRSANR
jgi:thioredoxin-dependent peroxiredoxin